jgi:hypothetical protein
LNSEEKKKKIKEDLKEFLAKSISDCDFAINNNKKKLEKINNEQSVLKGRKAELSKLLACLEKKIEKRINKK